jgi:hypothetical protein
MKTAIAQRMISVLLLLCILFTAGVFGVSAEEAVELDTSEIEELMGMSDRILVLAEHRITGELQKTDFNADVFMTYASAIVDGQEN